MERLLAIAAPRGIAVIEDGAQAIGARRRIGGAWRMAGELGYAGTFSFFPSKNLGGWGDGGMMTTQDDALAERLKRLRVHGGAKQYHHDEVGYNSRLDTLQAAILLAKLPHLAAWSEARRQRAARYTAALAGRAAGAAAGDRPGQRAHLPPVHHPGRAARRAAGAPAGQGDRLHDLLPGRRSTCSPASAISAIGAGSLPVTEQAMKEVISLPVYPGADRRPAGRDRSARFASSTGEPAEGRRDRRRGVGEEPRAHAGIDARRGAGRGLRRRSTRPAQPARSAVPRDVRHRRAGPAAEPGRSGGDRRPGAGPRRAGVRGDPGRRPGAGGEAVRAVGRPTPRRWPKRPRRRACRCWSGTCWCITRSSTGCAR